MAKDSDHTFKLLLVGDSGVGKSSILLRFTDNTFTDEIGSTIGVDFKVKHLNLRGKQLKLTIWDTAGQERFRTLTSSYYRGAQGIILAYDMTNRESFNNLERWVHEVDMYTTHPDVVTLLVGNKKDLVKDVTRQVSAEDAADFARKHGMLLLECSAKTKEGIQQAFEELVNKILDTPALLSGSGGPGSNPHIVPSGARPAQQESWCCGT